MSQEPTPIPKLSELSFEEIKQLVVRSMDAEQKNLLTQEANVETLNETIRQFQVNSMLKDEDAPLIIDIILTKFSKISLSGDTAKYIFIGSRDFYWNKETASSHQGYFLRLTPEMGVDDRDAEGKRKAATVEYNIWGETPNKRVQDAFSAGKSYDFEIKNKPDKKGRIDETTGEVKIYQNIADYRLIEDSKELLSTYIQNARAAHDVFARFTDGINSDIAKLMEPQMQYKPVIMEFEVSDMTALDISQRVLTGENYEWMTPKNADKHTVIKNNRSGQPQIVFNINGEYSLFTEDELKKPEAERKPYLVLSAYATFNAADMAQYFVSSPTFEKLFENPTFLAESPINQINFLSVQMRGKRVRIVGQMNSVDFSNEGDKVFINIGGVAFTEMPPVQ